MNNELKARTLTIEKTFDAPIELVWEAWSDPKHVAHWWAPKGMELEIVEHNFKAGGNWEYNMKMPDGSIFVAEGTYKEIVQLEKIISSADFKPMTEGIEIQVFLEAEGDKTKFTFNAVHPTVDYCKQQEEMGFYNGWGSVFEGLGNYLVSIK